MVRRSAAGRRGRQQSGASITQLEWREIENPYPATEILSDDHIDATCETAYRILEEVGMDILHEEARAMLQHAGADVESGSDRVRFDRGLISETLSKAPSQVTLHARNPARTLKLGGNRIAFGSVASAPNASDIAGGR